jgi:PAS domain S-box-containing protein
VERTFGDDEIIVSKTDTRGLITYANSVFCRISQYEEAELMGKPHNVIRHPDMPRCVFKLLWETIQAGDEMFAYVKNLASDGAHYWVLAHITPSFNGSGSIVGFHSNRRSPRRAAVQEVEAIYGDLLAEEKRHTDPREQMAASGHLLTSVLEAKGKTYDEFIWDVISRAEVAA